MIETLHRKAERAVMLTPEGRMLLMQAQEPSGSFTVWVAPGGGIKPNEDPEACLRREIEEETGMVLGEIGPLIWRRHHIFEWDGMMLSQHEDFYLVPTNEFEPDAWANPSEAEMAAFLQFRWWTAEEISASPDVFVPRLLPEHLKELVDHGSPDAPVDVGV